MRRHKPPTHMGSASKLPDWGSENPRVILIESTISINLHKGIRVTRFANYRSQKWEGGGSPLSQVMGEQERENR